MTDSKQEFERFAALMGQIEAVSAGDAKLSKEKVQFYFRALMDLTLDQIEANAVQYFRNDKRAFFPSIAALRGADADKDLQGQVAWDRIKGYLDRFYDPSIGNCCMKFIEERMRKNGEEHLYRLLVKWGPEILQTNAIAATRKHFLDAYKSEIEIDERRQLEAAGEIKALGNGNIFLEVGRDVVGNKE